MPAPGLIAAIGGSGRISPPLGWRDAPKTVIELSSQATSFVFTTDISQSEGPVHAEQYRRIADARGSAFVPVRLLCEADELARRIVSPERRNRSKWLDPEGVRGKHAAHTVLDLGDPGG